MVSLGDTAEVIVVILTGMVSVISSEFPKILFSDMWYDSKRLSACLISSASFILAVQHVES